jgi:hypothetical protein
VVGALAACGESSKADQARVNFEAGLRDSMETQAMPDAFVDCVVDASRGAVSDEELDSLPSDSDDSAAVYQSVARLAPEFQQIAMQCRSAV